MKIRFTLRTKAIISITLLIILVIFILNLFFINREKQIIHNALKQRGLALANGLAYNSEYGVLTTNRVDLENLIKGVMREADVAYCFVEEDSQGEILAAQGLKEELKTALDKALKKARGAEESVIQSFITARGQDYYHISVPVTTRRRPEATKDELGLFLIAEEGMKEIKKKGEEPVEPKKERPVSERKIGIVHIGLSLTSAAILIQRAQQAVMMITVLIIFLAGLITIFLTGFALAPIQKLVDATQKIAKGNLDSKVDIGTKDELGDLAQSFNAMASDLKTSTVSIEVLQREQKRFQDVTETSGDWIWEVDARGKYTYSSPIIERVLGYKPEEVIGKYFYDFFHPDDQEELRRKAFEVFAHKGTFKDFLNRNMRKDGRVVIIETSSTPVLSKNEKLLVYRVANRDITERKQAETALRESEELSRSIIDTATDAFIAIDEKGVVKEWNHKAEITFGWSLSKALGKPLAEIIIPLQHREAHTKGLRHFLERGEGPVLGKTIELTALHHDGHEFSVEITIWPIQLKGIYQFNAFVRDITERKKVEGELREKTDRLQRFQNVAVGRELYMLNLKEEVNKLLARSGQPKKYAVSEEIK